MEDTLVQNQTALRRPVRAISQANEDKKLRIKTWMAACMAIVALSIDGFQALLSLVGIGLIFGPIISVVAYFGFWIWFMILGVSFVGNPKKLMATGVGAIMEFVSFLPGFSLSVITTVLITIAEDKGGIIGKVAQGVQGKIT